MDPRLFTEWEGRTAAHRWSQTRGSGNPIGTRRGDLVFIVSREDSKTYTYLKQALACQSVDVMVDRRSGDRRQVWQPATPDRRNGDRRRRDVKTDLQTYGWALVHR